MQNKPYRVSRRRKHNSVWPVLLLLVAAVALALLISGIWQIAEGKSFFPQPDDLPPMRHSDAPEDWAPSSVPEGGDSESSDPEIGGAPEPEEPEEPEPPVFDGAVPESEPVPQSYFDDAVFVGDSITDGFTIYSGMENAKILAYTGINCSTISSAEVIMQDDGSRTTIMDELGKARYAKVYVMLGGNEVRDMAEDAFLSRYEKVLDDIAALQPDAVIYVQSMTPVTEANNYNMDNQRIDEFNQGILEMCKRKGLYYLNVAESMKDSRGMLPTEASPKDGMHFGQEYFNKWVDYLKSHTVPGTAAPTGAAQVPDASTESVSLSAMDALQEGENII